MQYMLGDSLLAAPIFREDGEVEYYLPAGKWVNLLTRQVLEGPGWHRGVFDYHALPLMVRPNSILPMGGAQGPAGLRLHPGCHPVPVLL